MASKLRRVIATSVVFLGLAYGAAHAQVPTTPAPAPAAQPASANTVEIDNPLKINNVREGISVIINLMTGISGTIALAAFVWGGFQMLVANGDSGKIEKGKNTLKYAVYGLVMIFGAYAALRAVYAVFGA